MSAWWFGVNNSRKSRADGEAGHMHYRDVVPLLRDGTTITWPFGGAPGSGKLYAEMKAGDDVVLWMGDGVEPAWGILGVAKIEAVDPTAQTVSLRRAGGPSNPLTPYEAGKPTETPITHALRSVFGDTYGPLRKLAKKLGVPGVEQKVVTIDRVNEDQLRQVLEMLMGVRHSPTPKTSPRFGSLPAPTRKIIATAARFIQQRRPEFYFASDEGGGKLRIYCGRIVPLSARPDRIWLSVTEGRLPAALASWSWDDHSDYPRYKRTPARNGYYTPSKDPSGSEWETTIAPAFFDYLDVLCTRGHRADHRTSSTPGLCEEIASWGGQEIEAASFEQSVRISSRSSSEERRERLRKAPRKPGVVTTVVTVFQRNPDVVAEVLARAAGTCEVCSSPAPFARASDGTPYLEVHHRVRLADGGDDTVENAVAACPNCHRKAHFG